MLSTSASASKQIIQSNCYILTFLAQSLACPWQFLSRVESSRIGVGSLLIVCLSYFFLNKTVCDRSKHEKNFETVTQRKQTRRKIETFRFSYSTTTFLRKTTTSSLAMNRTFVLTLTTYLIIFE